jgi:hypothetical protein
MADETADEGIAEKRATDVGAAAESVTDGEIAGYLVELDV